ncbi:MAG: B12-binding domain-containing radical SAM protein [Gammaproteobacteria bacterium]|nr:B12-binding domain-containing radical SAM protein [Gammaproteobacteria bacterium]
MTQDFRVLLINCNTMLDTLITAGIGILSAALRQEGVDVRLFDTTFYRTAERTGDQARASALQVKPTRFEDLGIQPEENDVVEDFVRTVQDYRPHLIGLSCIEVTWPLGLRLLEAVRHTGIPTIVGGAYATFAPDIVMRRPAVDMVCVGEGELALPELCRRMRAGADHTDIRNLWVKHDGRLYKNPMRAGVDMRELPFQDWEVYDRRRFWKPMGGKISVTGTFEMNRGCPYTCTYCINSGLNLLYADHGGYYREQDIDRLVDEMVEKKERYNLGFVYLVAESFLTTNRKRVERFGQRYAEVGLPFWVEARPESISRAKVQMLEDIGCEGISVGVESGNEDFRRRVLGRNVTNDRIIHAFELLADSRIRVSANNIIGFPYETREQIFETIELDRRIDVQGVMVSFFSPYRGCTLREICELEGFIGEEDIAMDYRLGPSMDQPQLTRSELRGLHRAFPLYVKFPKSEWDVIRRCEDDDPQAEALYQQYAERYRREFMQ